MFSLLWLLGAFSKSNAFIEGSQKGSLIPRSRPKFSLNPEIPTANTGRSQSWSFLFFLSFVFSKRAFLMGDDFLNRHWSIEVFANRNCRSFPCCGYGSLGLLSVFAFVLQPCVWSSFDLRCVSLLGELPEIQRLWVCILLSTQNTPEKIAKGYPLTIQHLVRRTSRNKSGKIKLSFRLSFLLQNTEWKREPSYLLPNFIMHSRLWNRRTNKNYIANTKCTSQSLFSDKWRIVNSARIWTSDSYENKM